MVKLSNSEKKKKDYFLPFLIYISQFWLYNLQLHIYIMQFWGSHGLMVTESDS